MPIVLKVYIYVTKQLGYHFVVDCIQFNGYLLIFIYCSVAVLIYYRTVKIRLLKLSAPSLKLLAIGNFLNDTCAICRWHRNL